MSSSNSRKLRRRQEKREKQEKKRAKPAQGSQAPFDPWTQNPPAFQVVTGGVTGTEEPDWSKAPKVGDRLVDGTCTWEHIEPPAGITVMDGASGVLTNVHFFGFGPPKLVGNSALLAIDSSVAGVAKHLWEQVSGDDGYRRAVVTHDVDAATSTVRAAEDKRQTKEEYERETLRILADAKPLGGDQAHTFKWVPPEDDEYEDGWLCAGEREVGVQVRQFDGDFGCWADARTRVIGPRARSAERCR